MPGLEIVEINLRALPDLEEWPFGRGPTYLIAWVDDDLLGACFVPRLEDADALTRHLAAEFGDLWRQRAVAAATGNPADWNTEPRPATTEPVTVVVCTRDRPGPLERCLSSVAPQLRGDDELLVIDNARVPGAAAVARAAGARHVHEPRPGSSWARNRGFREAQHEIVAYIDDDCVADRMWLQAIRESFADGGIAGTTGNVLARRADAPLPALLDERYPFTRGWYPLRFAGSTNTDLSPADAWRLGTGASMAWRKRVLDRLDGFDPALGAGTAPGGMEDLDFFRRVLLEGGTVLYEPAALVFHDHPESLAEVRRMLVRYGLNRGAQTAKVLLEDRRARRNTVRALLAEWRWQLSWARHETMNLLLRRPRLPVSAILAGPPAALVGAVRFLRHRRALRHPALE